MKRLKLPERIKRLSALYGRMQGAIERGEWPAEDDVVEMLSLLTPDDIAYLRPFAIATLQDLAAQGNAEAIDLAREMHLPKLSAQIQ
jgi:hypothetical protein